MSNSDWASGAADTALSAEMATQQQRRNSLPPSCGASGDTMRCDAADDGCSRGTSGEAANAVPDLPQSFPYDDRFATHADLCASVAAFVSERRRSNWPFRQPCDYSRKRTRDALPTRWLREMFASTNPADAIKYKGFLYCDYKCGHGDDDNQTRCCWKIKYRIATSGFWEVVESGSCWNHNHGASFDPAASFDAAITHLPPPQPFFTDHLTHKSQPWPHHADGSPLSCSELTAAHIARNCDYIALALLFCVRESHRLLRKQPQRLPHALLRFLNAQLMPCADLRQRVLCGHLAHVSFTLATNYKFSEHERAACRLSEAIVERVYRGFCRRLQVCEGDHSCVFSCFT